MRIEDSIGYRFFEFRGGMTSLDNKLFPLDFSLKIHTPTWKRLRVGKQASVFHYLFWFLFSRLKYKIYYVLHENQIVHMSHLISQNPKFPFLGPNDFEIGPCWTHPGFRGKGIYPRVLAKIIRDHHADEGRLYIFAEMENSPSLKGISKAGFEYIGSGEKVGVLGIYRILDYKNGTTQ